MARTAEDIYRDLLARGRTLAQIRAVAIALNNDALLSLVKATQEQIDSASVFA